MKNSKLISLLVTFTAKDMRLLTEFVTSPYYNKNINIISLFGVLERSYPNFWEEKMEKKKIFQQVYGEKKFDDVKLRGLFSDALALTEEFLALENMKRVGFSTEPFLLNELFKRNSFRLLEIRLKEMKAKKNDGVHDKFYFLNQLLIAEEETYYRIENSQGAEEKLVGTTLYEDALNYLIEFAAYEAYHFSITMDFLKDNIQYPAEKKRIVESILTLSDQIEKTELFQYLEWCKRIAADYDEVAYKKLKDLLFGNIPPYLSRMDLSEGLFSLYNFTVFLFIKGDSKYVKDSFLINKRIIEFGLHLKDGMMGETQFTNSVIDALKVNEWKWANEFIDTHAKRLKPEVRDETVNWCKGFVCEKQGKYSEALGYLSKVNSSSLMLNLNLKLSFIKVFYAKGDMPQVILNCNNFVKYLKANKKLPEFKINPLVNFAEYMIKLARIRMTKKKDEISKFIAEVEAHQEMNLKAWMLERANEILSS